MENRTLPLLYAPPEYWSLTEEQHKEVCNGCGPRGILGILVPNNLFGVDITEACNIHDYMYHIGQTIADKEAADRVLLNNMLRIIEEAHGWPAFGWLQRKRVRKAELYYDVVVKFGGPWFWAGKNDPSELGVCFA